MRLALEVVQTELQTFSLQWVLEATVTLRFPVPDTPNTDWFGPAFTRAREIVPLSEKHQDGGLNNVGIGFCTKRGDSVRVSAERLTQHSSPMRARSKRTIYDGLKKKKKLKPHNFFVFLVSSAVYAGVNCDQNETSTVSKNTRKSEHREKVNFRDRNVFKQGRSCCAKEF